MLLLGAGKLGKVLLTSSTMLLSVFTYSFIFGWRYAAGFVALIFIHEMGHFIAARQRGLDVGAPTFIPFVGAWIEMKSLPHDAETEAYVGLGGPVAGTLGAFACYALAYTQHSPLLLALAYAGFMLNLFNMLPISPLDGGRIGLPGDLDGAALFFMSDESRFVTGQVLSVDGGWCVSEGQHE